MFSSLYVPRGYRADVGHDLWAFCHDNRLKLPFWYNVAKDIALIQPSSVFMERVFSIPRACLDERQETCYYSDRIGASALLKKITFFLYQGRSSLYCYAGCCCFSHSAYWLPTRKNYFTRWPDPLARGLLNREKRTKEVWQHTHPPLSTMLVRRKIKKR